MIKKHDQKEPKESVIKKPKERKKETQKEHTSKIPKPARLKILNPYDVYQKAPAKASFRIGFTDLHFLLLGLITQFFCT